METRINSMEDQEQTIGEEEVNSVNDKVGNKVK